MFCTTNVKIYLVPVIAGFAVAKGFTVVRIHVTEKIPGRTCVAWHGGGFPHPPPLSTSWRRVTNFVILKLFFGSLTF